MGIYSRRLYLLSAVQLNRPSSSKERALKRPGFNMTRYPTGYIRIAVLSSLDDAAPVKKHHFIKCYHLAREEGLTPKAIKSGWRTSGIYPWNP
jgi:hypothetical protein